MPLSQAIKAVAFAYGRQTNRNEHSTIYGEMYRKSEIASYNLLPVACFQESLDWLTE